MLKYSENEIIDFFDNELSKKRNEVDVLPLKELKQLLLDGWVIYQLESNADGLKVMVLGKADI